MFTVDGEIEVVNGFNRIEIELPELIDNDNSISSRKFQIKDTTGKIVYTFPVNNRSSFVVYMYEGLDYDTVYTLDYLVTYYNHYTYEVVASTTFRTQYNRPRIMLDDSQYSWDGLYDTTVYYNYDNTYGNIVAATIYLRTGNEIKAEADITDLFLTGKGSGEYTFTYILGTSAANMESKRYSVDIQYSYVLTGDTDAYIDNSWTEFHLNNATNIYA